jgi:hypothetical protein
MLSFASLTTPVTARLLFSFDGHRTIVGAFPSLPGRGVFGVVARLRARIGTLTVSRSARCGSGLGPGGMLLATTKQDCRDSSSPGAPSLIAFGRLLLGALSGRGREALVPWNAPQVDREQPLLVGVVGLEHRTREGDPGVVAELVHDADLAALIAAYSPTVTRSLASSWARCASAPRPRAARPSRLAQRR